MNNYFLFFLRNWVTVGGIRSTGASACLAIAEYVYQEMKARLVLPASIPVTMETPYQLTFTVTDHCSIIMDDQEYRATHPIAKHGLSSHIRANQGIKAKL